MIRTRRPGSGFAWPLPLVVEPDSAKSVKSSSDLADQESWTMGRLRERSAGTASMQYFVQAARESRQPRRSRMMVTLGCSEMIFIF